MTRIVAAAALGLLIGGVSVWLLLPRQAEPQPEVVRDIGDVPKMTVAEGAEHRESGFRELATIEQVLALPTRFTQSEALHVLAGRNDSAGIQELVFEANRIADQQDREIALKILFFRLTEVDPYSALALIRTPFFESNQVVERQVWMAFGLNDLDEAIAAAKEQASTRRQHAAVQALYAAYGYMGNDHTDRIELETGIRPDRGNRAQFLYRMADRSPAEAIAYINAMDNGQERMEFVSWLASYLAGQDAAGAESFETLFAENRDREIYKTVVGRDSAKEDPRAIVDQLIASGRSGLNPAAIQSALSQFARQNLDDAILYFDQLKFADDRRTMGNAIAQELARRDTDRALAWARANDEGAFPMFEMTVLRQIAAEDPRRAVAEAMASNDSQARSNLVMNLANSLGRTDPREALDIAGEVSNRQEGNRLRQGIIANWMKNDADAAIAWIGQQDKQTRSDLLEEPRLGVRRYSPDVAMRILPLLTEEEAARWRPAIAQQLAATGSLDEALNFINRFEAQEGFQELRSSLIAGLAQNDPDAARLMADQLTDSQARDAAYSQIAMHKARSDPAGAAGMLNLIAGKVQKVSSATAVARQWASQDAVAARQWVENLPRGDVRDAAITGLAATWTTMGPDEQALIDSITDDAARQQAIINQIYVVMRTDPKAARDLLADSDISELQRRRLATQIERIIGRAY